MLLSILNNEFLLICRNKDFRDKVVHIGAKIDNYCNFY